MPVLYSGCGQQVYLPEKECDECEQFETRLTRVEDELPNKQDQLSTGYGIDINNDTISADLTEIQEKLVAGDGIRIIDDVISVINSNGDPHFWSDNGVVYVTELDKDSYLNTGDGIALLIDNTCFTILSDNVQIMKIEKLASGTGTEFGTGSTATGRDSFAEGYNTESSAYYSHAEGDCTHATALASHAEGSDSYATATDAHAEGNGTYATAAWAHSEGTQTHADGDASHSEGFASYATGYYSHAQNHHTKASKRAQTAIGTYNVEDTSSTTTHPTNLSDYGEYAFIIGNGTGEGTDRSNALTVDWQGNVKCNDATDASGNSLSSLTLHKDTVSLESGFDLYNPDEPIEVKRVGKVCSITGAVKPTVSIPGTSVRRTICNLPSGYFPSKILNSIMQASTSKFWFLTIQTDGRVQFSRLRDTDSASGVFEDAGTSEWLPFHATWIID